MKAKLSMPANPTWRFSARHATHVYPREHQQRADIELPGIAHCVTVSAVLAGAAISPLGLTRSIRARIANAKTCLNSGLTRAANSLATPITRAPSIAP